MKKYILISLYGGGEDVHDADIMSMLTHSSMVV